jgi:hypothetical protein
MDRQEDRPKNRMSHTARKKLRRTQKKKLRKIGRKKNRPNIFRLKWRQRKL